MDTHGTGMGQSVDNGHGMAGRLRRVGQIAGSLCLVCSRRWPRRPKQVPDGTSPTSYACLYRFSTSAMSENALASAASVLSSRMHAHSPRLRF